jgi:hypothetical protein
MWDAGIDWASEHHDALVIDEKGPNECRHSSFPVFLVASADSKNFWCN